MIRFVFGRQTLKTFCLLKCWIFYVDWLH